MPVTVYIDRSAVTPPASSVLRNLLIEINSRFETTRYLVDMHELRGKSLLTGRDTLHLLRVHDELQSVR